MRYMTILWVCDFFLITQLRLYELFELNLDLIKEF